MTRARAILLIICGVVAAVAIDHISYVEHWATWVCYLVGLVLGIPIGHGLWHLVGPFK